MHAEVRERISITAGSFGQRRLPPLNICLGYYNDAEIPCKNRLQPTAQAGDGRVVQQSSLAFSSIGLQRALTGESSARYLGKKLSKSSLISDLRCDDYGLGSTEPPVVEPTCTTQFSHSQHYRETSSNIRRRQPQMHRVSLGTRHDL